MNISTLVPTATSIDPAIDPERVTRNEQRRRRGAPKGNKNAARHGFYSRKNFEANMAFLKENTDFGRADREIFLAIRKIAEVELRDPSNESLQLKVLNCFLKLVMRKYGITDKRDEEALGNALDQVERDIVLPPDQMAALVKQLV
jgi:hypothetical protein